MMLLGVNNLIRVNQALFIFISYLLEKINLIKYFSLILGSIFPSAGSYWSNPSANLYSNIAAAGGHGIAHHAAPHLAAPPLPTYSHYA